jgi:serine protease
MFSLRLRTDRNARLAGVLGCAAALALAGCAANGSIAPTTASTISGQAGSMHVLRYLPTRNPGRGIAPNSGSGEGVLTYNGGPVLLKPKAYLIFWGYKKYGDPDKVAPLLDAYFKSVGGSGHNSIYTQYYDVVGSKTTYITNFRGQLGGVWLDNTNAVPAEPTDLQVAKEALNGVSHFGYDANGSYIVATPHGRSTIGFGTQWCAYHSSTQVGSGVVSYTNFPYIPDAGESCGAGATSPPKDQRAKDEGVTIVEGTEYGESITDPNPGTGWYNFEYGEIGECGWSIANDPFGKKSYTTAAMYSDATESCLQEYFAQQ